MFSGHLACLSQTECEATNQVDSSACLMDSRPWLVIPNSHACMQKLLLNLNAPLASCSCIYYYASNAPTNCSDPSAAYTGIDPSITHAYSSRPGVGPAALLQSAEGDKSSLIKRKAMESLAESIARQPVTSIRPPPKEGDVASD